MHTYDTTAVASGAPAHVAVERSSLDIGLMTPKELGGAGGEGAAAEDLLAAGFASCLLAALQQAAIVAGDASAKAQVNTNAHLEGDGKQYKLALRLEVSIPGAKDPQMLLDKALDAWPYGRDPVSKRFTVDVSLADGAQQGDPTGRRGYGG